jgi:hypothetical protein
MEDVIDYESPDLNYIYRQLKDRYELVLTNTFALNDGYTDDHPVLCGSNGKMKFHLYSDYGIPVFSVQNMERTAGTHGHPEGTMDALEYVAEFMEGRFEWELQPFSVK